MGLIKIHSGLRSLSKVATQLRGTPASTTRICTLSSPYSTGFTEGSTTVQTNDGSTRPPGGGNLDQEPHGQRPQALPNDPQVKSAAEMGNQSNASRDRLRYKRWVEPYEKAVVNGYVGSYEMWKLSEQLCVVNKRTTGASPYITTLKKLRETPLPEELIRTTVNSTEHLFSRNVVVDNQVVGKARFYIAPKGEQVPLKPIWVRPYFDHEAKRLRFQLPDGSDHAYSKSLTSVAGSVARPILYLAYREGLIDLVPDDRLRSLEFDTVRRSGYAIHSNLAPNTLRTYCRGTMHVHQIDRESQAAASGGDDTTPAYKAASFQFFSTPQNIGDRKCINYLPYIGDEDGKLRLWDVDEAQDITLSQGKLQRRSSGLSVKDIKKRYPPLYALARSEGFGEDAKCPMKHLLHHFLPCNVGKRLDWSLSEA